MSHHDDLAALIALYRAAPDDHPSPSRADWAIAATLLQRGVTPGHLAHAIRLATLRRSLQNPLPPPVRSLAYYRAVLDRLAPDELEPGYVDYVRWRFRHDHPDDRNPHPTQSATSPPKSRRS